MQTVMDDRELLRDFTERRSQDAFRQLVERHLPMVFSTARRMVRDSHLAEEVAQNVFTTLAQKAPSIRPPQVVGGWLYNTTRHLALHAVRSEQRRREREQTAFAMQNLDFTADEPRITEHLEPAMEELESDDRDALVLRYLENRSLREVGTELGISEDAARMRVNRALERLRTAFGSHDIAAGTVVLATAITATAVVPAGLAAAITANAFAQATVAATASGVSTSTFGIVKWLFMTKLKTSLLVAALAVGITVLLVVRNDSSHQPLNTANADSQASNVERHQPVNPLANRRAAATSPLTDEHPEIALLKKILYSPVNDGMWPSADLRAAIVGFGQGTNVLVKLLIEALETGKHEARMRAMSSLAILGPNARDALPAMLKLIDEPAEDAPTILRFAVQIAREPAFAKDLVELYRNAAPNGSAPGGYYPTLKDTLRSAPLSGAVLQALQQLVKNRNDVAESAAHSVGDILVNYLNDPDYDIQILAAQALAQLPGEHQAAAVRGFAALLTQPLPDSLRSTWNRQTAAIQGLAALRQIAAPAIPALQTFIGSNLNPSLRKMAEEAVVSISSAAATLAYGSPSEASAKPPVPVDEQQTALAGKVLKGTATVIELGLALTNSDQRTRVKAARSLNGLGKDGVAALPQLQQALPAADEVFKELLLLTHREIAPDVLQPLYRKQDLLPALRVVADDLGKTPQGETTQTEINRASRSFFYDHAQIVSLADTIGAYDSQLRERFVSKLVENHPPLAALFKSKP